MKNILICFLTHKNTPEAKKLAKSYFDSCDIMHPHEISLLSAKDVPKARGFRLVIANSLNASLAGDISKLTSDTDFQFFTILLVDQDYPVSDLETSLTHHFDIAVNISNGYQKAALIIDRLICVERLEDELVEADRKYNTLVNNLPGITYRCKNDSDWTMLYLSKKMEKLTGYPARSFINNKNLTYSDIIIPQDRERVWLTIQKAIKRNLSFTLEYRIKTSTGRIKWVWEQGRRIVLSNHDDILEGVIMDIDEKKNQEQRLQLIRSIILDTAASNDLPDLIGLLQKQVQKLVIAPFFEFLLFDWEKREFLVPFVEDDKEFYKKIPMDKTLDALVIKRNRTIYLKKHEILKLERQGKIKLDGEPPEVWLGVPVQLNGKASGIIVLQDFDNEFAINETDVELLEFVSVQVNVSIRNKHLRDETGKLLRALEQSPVSVIITDLNGHIIYANKKAAATTGRLVKEMLGKIPDIIEPYKSEPEHFSNIWNALKTTGEWQGEFKNEHHVLGSCWEYAFISAIKNSRNKTTNYIYIKEEITERKRIEIELREAKIHAEESDRLKTAFLANMSHEIRTPMNAIIGFTEMLKTDDYSENEHDEFCDLIIENSKKLLNTIENIIDIAKIEAGQMTISKSKCSANKILYDNFYAFEKIKRKLDKDHIKFVAKQNMPDENLLFSSDPLRISQVVANLIENAFKYTSRGMIEVGYKLVDKKDKPCIDFYVKDSGLGISSHKLEVIFERFTQVSDNYMSTAGGTGLGLSISRNIARLMKGDIFVESNAGKGSVFHFIIPYEPFVQNVFLPGKQKKDKLRKEMDWPDKTVLITEDEDSNFKLLEIMLRKTKIKIERAFNGKQAVDFVIGGNDVDVVLMDVRMPVMNGYEATEHIKKFNPYLPVIIQTAFALSGDRENGFEAGCDEYLSKPIKATELFQLMRKFLH